MSALKFDYQMRLHAIFLSRVSFCTFQNKRIKINISWNLSQVYGYRNLWLPYFWSYSNSISFLSEFFLSIIFIILYTFPPFKTCPYFKPLLHLSSEHSFQPKLAITTHFLSFVYPVAWTVLGQREPKRHAHWLK